jgi:RimJ/RimL family protein N-acetyltransferase
MKSSKRITTGRLVMREPRQDDAEAVFKNYAQDKEVTRYLSWKPHALISETEEFLAKCVERFGKGDRLPWVVTKPEEDKAIGMIELWLNPPRAEVGFVLSRKEWGKGMMTECLKALIDFSFERPDIHRFGAICDIENVASARVMEKAGMVKEGVLRKFIYHPNAGRDPRDVYSYVKIRI